MARKGIKKWFMLQMWRLQQIASIGTLVLLMLNLALQLFGFVKWRGEVLNNPYFTVPLIALILAAIVWGVAIVWDLRLKMWRDQATVLVERNPYTKERLSSKEVFLYGLVYIPVMERLAKDDPKIDEALKVIKEWFRKETGEDPQLVRDVKGIFAHVGAGSYDQLGLEKK